MENIFIDNSLFPETPPILWGYNHFVFLKKILPYKRMLQQDLIQKTGLNKTTLSEIKADLIKMGWCKDVDLGSGKEIMIKLCNLKEIKLFLGHWEFLKHAFFVRPHSIKARCLFKVKPEENFEKAINRLSINKKWKLIISSMKNNKEYTLVTEYGKIILLQNSRLVQFLVEGFILPIRKEDIDKLEDYIVEGIQYKLLSMHNLIKEHLYNFKIEIFDIIYLRSLHMGIITKNNVSKIVHLKNKIRSLGMFVDKSIYDCDEIEAKGRLEEVLNKIKNIMEELFHQQDKSDNFVDKKSLNPLDLIA